MIDRDSLPEFMTVDEVADLLKVTSRTVRRHIADGTLRVVRFGGAIRITREALLESLKTEEVPQKKE